MATTTAPATAAPMAALASEIRCKTCTKFGHETKECPGATSASAPEKTPVGPAEDAKDAASKDAAAPAEPLTAEAAAAPAAAATAAEAKAGLKPAALAPEAGAAPAATEAATTRPEDKPEPPPDCIHCGKRRGHPGPDCPYNRMEIFGKRSGADKTYKNEVGDTAGDAADSFGMDDREANQVDRRATQSAPGLTTIVKTVRTVYRKARDMKRKHLPAKAAGAEGTGGSAEAKSA